ncbi:adhesion G-protein coupled receptor D1-like [Macrobrachium nipponense]|uniref:adhesion G-protein coupled receptor D1-like n=1 Tax=Macrobrachium nipponense TaxID=159736 RepID=UPI0030C7D616
MTSLPVGGALGLALLLTLFAVATTVTNINGEWSPWSNMATPCTKSCGGGVNLKVRSCTNPSPQGSGQLCLKMDLVSRADKEWKSFDCNTQSCWGLVWGNWGNCSVHCGKGVRTRYSMCGTDVCNGTMAKSQSEPCNDWNKTACPSPCEDMTCPQFGVCQDKSTVQEPIAICVCTMGYEMNPDKTSCIRPPPTTPTPRPIPTLAPEQKVVATVISKSASTLIIIMVSITLGLFLFLRVFTTDRVIQMNMEIALLLAHILLILPGNVNKIPVACTVISILVHFFFTACFMFMLLEALHMYSLVAYVVKKDGMFSKAQNVLVGWGMAAFVVLVCMAFQLDNYGGDYHCWLRMDTPLVYGHFIPIIIIIILTFALIEAAGAVSYKPLTGMDRTQLLSAKISQRTNLIIMPLVFSHWMVGMLSEYEQNLPLYGTFSILNGVTGVAVFLLHSSNNQQVREKLRGCYRSMCKGSAVSR